MGGKHWTINELTELEWDYADITISFDELIVKYNRTAKQIREN